MKQLFSTLLILAAISAHAAPQRNCDEMSVNGTCSLYSVSIVELIANPTKFNGKRVRIIGYLNLEFEGNAIYLHHDDFIHSIYENGLWVDVAKGLRQTEPKCESKSYALIEGRFVAANRGHGGGWHGAIEDVTRCSPWR